MLDPYFALFTGMLACAMWCIKWALDIPAERGWDRLWSILGALACANAAVALGVMAVTQ